MVEIKLDKTALESSIAVLENKICEALLPADISFGEGTIKSLVTLSSIMQKVQIINDNTQKLTVQVTIDLQACQQIMTEQDKQMNIELL